MDDDHRASRKNSELFAILSIYRHALLFMGTSRSICHIAASVEHLKDDSLIWLLCGGASAFIHLFWVMLTPKLLYVAPAQRHHGGGATAAARSKLDLWVVRTVALALASTVVSTSSAASEIDANSGMEVPLVSGEAVVVESNGVGEHMAGILESAEGKAASLLESLLASFDVLLTEFGLPGTSMVCVAVAVAVLAFIFIRKAGGIAGGSGGASAKRRAVLFLGPCGAGKTAMMHRLCHDRLVPTVTSMETCKYEYSVRRPDARAKASSGPSATLVDYPGHERLRAGLREELCRAERIVFVLDGSCLAAQISAAAELFYDVLTDPSVEGCRGLLLALNKSDVKEAKATRAKSLLQKEIEKLRGTRGTLGTQGEENDLPEMLALGRPGQPFSLEIDSPCEVGVALCSVKDGSMDAVAEFVWASAR